MTQFRPRHAVLLLIAAAAIVGPATAVYLSRPQLAGTVPDVHPPARSQLAGTVPDVRAFGRFETMAVSACRCARGKDEAGIKACWAEFDKATAPFAPSSVVSMCMDSNESLCFGMSGGIVTPEVAKRIKCISVNRSGSGVCTAGEARAAAANASGSDC